MTTTAHGAISAAIEQMGRAQRETGAYLSRVVGCPRGGLGVVRVLEHGPRQVSDIAQGLRVDASVASRQVAALAAAGLVATDVPADDRRARLVALTDAGRALAARHAAAVEALSDQVFADWSEDEIEAAAHQFRKVAEAVDRHAEALTAVPPVAPLSPAPEPSPSAQPRQSSEREIA